jgi:hypothetical protein
LTVFFVFGIDRVRPSNPVLFSTSADAEVDLARRTVRSSTPISFAIATLDISGFSFTARTARAPGEMYGAPQLQNTSAVTPHIEQCIRALVSRDTTVMAL